MSTTAGSGVEVVAIDTPALGDRSYLAHDGEVALVVDPQRDIDRVLALAAARGVRITHVLETHLHNDYVTGGLALARATGAAYHVNAADQVAFDRVPASDGDVIEVSPVMRVGVLATPGHTFTHLSYVLEAGGHAHAVFTGGSLLCGFSGTGLELVVFRLVQAVGAGFLFSNSAAIITDAFPPNERGRALGVNQVSIVVGAVSGLVLGGLITSTMLTLIVVPVVYTYLDDFGSRVVAFLTAGSRAKKEAAQKQGAPQPEPVPAD